MMPVLRRIIILLVFTAGVCISWIQAESLILNRITLDPNRWGERTLTLPIENPVDDTARLKISLVVGYANHYLSGEEKMAFDTAFIIPPGFSGTRQMNFTLDGSFGRAKISLLAKWKYVNTPQLAVHDSTFQTFSNNFAARGDALGLDNYRYALGPMHAAWIDRHFNFEYPRLLLYLVSRGKTVDEVQHMFYPDSNYTRELADHFRRRGILPKESSDEPQSFLALSENEAFAIHAQAKAFSEEVCSWYRSKGSSRLDTCLSESGVDSAAALIPALRLAMLYSLLVEPWIADSEDSWRAFADWQEDVETLNRPRWLVQGGAYFQPRLCLAAFVSGEDNELLLGTFSPDYSLVCSKLAMIFMHERAKKDLSIRDAAIAGVSTSALRRAIETARDRNVGAGIRKILDKLINESRKHVAHYNDRMSAALADYICRNALASCFTDEPQLMLDKFVAVRY